MKLNQLGKLKALCFEHCWFPKQKKIKLKMQVLYFKIQIF